MFCCAGFASICRSPFFGLDTAPEATGYSSLPMGLYDTALSSAFQLPSQIFLRLSYPDCPLPLITHLTTHKIPMSFNFVGARLQTSLPSIVVSINSHKGEIT